MRQTGFHVSPGTETQVAVTPTLISTSEVGINMRTDWNFVVINDQTA